MQAYPTLVLQATNTGRVRRVGCEARLAMSAYTAPTHFSVQVVTMSSLNLRDTSVELIWQSALLSLTNNHLLLSMVIFTWLLGHA